MNKPHEKFAPVMINVLLNDSFGLMIKNIHKEITKLLKKLGALHFNFIQFDSKYTYIQFSIKLIHNQVGL